MRRPAVLLSIALLAGVLLVRRRRRRAPHSSLDGRPPATPLAPPADATRFVSVPWELVAAPADEPALTIRHERDEHMELDRVDAQETPTQVFVTVLMRWRPPAGGWFTFAQEHETVVPLAQPLGERELVHAPVDLEAPGGEPDDRPLYP